MKKETKPRNKPQHIIITVKLELKHSTNGFPDRLAQIAEKHHANRMGIPKATNAI